MCRLCGRFVKCIFDTMPSRTYQVPSRRAFSTIRRLPTIQPRTTTLTTSRSSIPSLTSAFSTLTFSSTPKLPQIFPSSISAPTTSPSLQIRTFSASAAVGAPRNTYNPSRRVQKRRHGFLARLKSKSGQEILKRRRAKGRKYLSW